MNGNERLEDIRVKLQTAGSVNVEELRECYRVSPETIRRDLARLVTEGIAIRTYGGAVFNKEGHAAKVAFAVRSETNQREKRRVAAIAARLLPAHQHIGCDASTTAMEMLRLLREREDLTFLTNSTQAILEMLDSKCGIRSTGGTVDFKAGYMLGVPAKEAIASYNLDYSFLSCKGIDLEGNVYDTHESETDLKRAFMQRSRMKVLLAGHSKIGRYGFTSWAHVQDFNLFITDERPPEELVRILERNHVELLYESK